MILKTDSAETTVELSHMRVAVKLPIRNKDQSGDSTATDTTSSGTKAKIISVSGRIAKEDAATLTNLIKLAEAETDTGARVKYTIKDDTADAADVRTVIFHEDFDAREIDGLHAWAVTFSLREVVSVPELKQQRTAPASVSANNASATGQTIAATTTEAEPEAHGTLFKLLKEIDDMLASDEEGSV